VSGIAADTVVDGRYKLVSRLGSGGMADVWCAEDLQLGRQVALKLLHDRFAQDDDFVERFRREASSAAGLQHPNVVQIYDRGEWEGTYYIAMEFLAGQSLKDVVQDEAPLPPDRAIDLTIQILRAARFAHRRAIIHRDLKPHNVIVDGEGRAKVTDFGIARSGASDMTETGSILGTAHYLSPEQAQGHAVSERSDVYSIGIILYELLTGSVPFDGDSAVTIALKQVSEPPVPPASVNPAISPELEAVVLRALAKEPEYRFGDADEFIAALEGARTGVMPEGSATTAFVPVAEREDEGPRWWLWALLAALVVGAAVAAVLLLARSETSSVPRVVGADVVSAARALRNEGFRPVVERVRNDAPAERVIGQNPLPGTQLEEGSEVTLTVSSGPGTRAVPDVSGLEAEEARGRLRRAGFRVRERRQASATVDDGRVISTVPSIGVEARIGAFVTLVISSGPERVVVPDLTGDDLDTARSELDQLGLTADVTRQESEDAEPGTVLSQDPAAGSQVDEGSAVAITVAEEPSEVTVPSVRGRDESEAVAALSSAGFEVDVQDAPVKRPSQDGKVITQSPGGGTRLERGGRVTVTVGRFDDTQLDPEPDEEDPADEDPGGQPGGEQPGTPGVQPGGLVTP
jgi:serine/threonine-protein kinase